MAPAPPAGHPERAAPERAPPGMPVTVEVMSLAQQIQSDLTAAMKARDAQTTKALRMVLAAIKNLRVAAGRDQAEPTDEEVLGLLTSESKKRRESVEAFEEAGRDDLAAEERAALAVIQRYLPEQLSEDEIRTLVDEAVAQVGASGPGDLGKVMGALMPKVKGRADGKVVNRLVRERLSG